MQKCSSLLNNLAEWVWYLENTTVVVANVSGKGTEHSIRESKIPPINSKFVCCGLALTPSCLNGNFSFQKRSLPTPCHQHGNISGLLSGTQSDQTEIDGNIHWKNCPMSFVCLLFCFVLF